MCALCLHHSAALHVRRAHSAYALKRSMALPCRFPSSPDGALRLRHMRTPSKSCTHADTFQIMHTCGHPPNHAHMRTPSKSCRHPPNHAHMQTPSKPCTHADTFQIMQTHADMSRHPPNHRGRLTRCKWPGDHLSTCKPCGSAEPCLDHRAQLTRPTQNPQHMVSPTGAPTACLLLHRLTARSKMLASPHAENCLPHRTQQTACLTARSKLLASPHAPQPRSSAACSLQALP